MSTEHWWAISIYSLLFFLPGRMGNSRSALKMIMEELQDVDKAIEFAKEQDDGELWEDLILYSIDKPRKWDCFWETCMCGMLLQMKDWITHMYVTEGVFVWSGRCYSLFCPSVHKNLQ